MRLVIFILIASIVNHLSSGYARLLCYVRRVNMIYCRARLPLSACARCVVNWCAHVFVLCVATWVKNSKNCFYLKIHRKKTTTRTQAKRKRAYWNKKEPPTTNCAMSVMIFCSARFCAALRCLCAVFASVSVFIFWWGQCPMDTILS